RRREATRERRGDAARAVVEGLQRLYDASAATVSGAFRRAPGPRVRTVPAEAGTHVSALLRCLLGGLRFPGRLSRPFGFLQPLDDRIDAIAPLLVVVSIDRHGLRYDRLGRTRDPAHWFQSPDRTGWACGLLKLTGQNR